MRTQSQSPPYRWILPLGPLFICAIILWPIRLTLLSKEAPVQFSFNISTTPRNQQSPNAPEFGPYLELDSPEIERSIRNTNRRLWAPMLMNSPAMIVVLPFVIHNPAKTEWTPNGMNFKKWRAISWPFIGLIFWWIAGRGFEALFAVRRSVIHPAISLVETGVGLVLSLGGVMIFIAALGGADSDGDVPKVAICVSGVVWICLGASVVIARFAQRKIRLGLREV